MLVRLGTLAGVAALAATLAFVCPAQAQDTVADRRAAYEDALDRVSALSAQHARVAELAATTEARAEDLRAGIDGDSGGLVDTVTGFFTGEPSDLDRAAEAAQDAEHARELADLVQTALLDQIAVASTARRSWERAERQRMEVESALTASEYAERAVEFATFGADYAADDAEQDRLNHGALAAWHQQLRDVADAAVVPPALAELADSADLPDGLEPARGAGFDIAAGVAEAEQPGGAEVTVLSAETVRAVSEAFRLVGRTPSTDATAYACGGLVADVWAGPDHGVPADTLGHWESLAPVPTDSAQVGDVVLLGSREDGLTGSGIFVGDGRAVVADATTGAVAVQTFTELLGVRRVGIDASEPPAPAPEGGTCGIEPLVTEGGVLVVPVPAATYVVTAEFGDGGSLWSSGAHTGLDFAAPIGTPVLAAAGGTVTVEHPAWAGSLVRIDHGDGMETWYAHLSRTGVATGDVVEAGTPVGLVGDEGNSTGPHLHFEVRLHGTPQDPAPLLGLP